MVLLIILLTVFIFIYLLIIEVFTILFRVSGISEDQARFQVISLLTSSGFTTTHSEAITINSYRRRLAMIVMLFGYFFTVIIVALLINIILELNNAELSGLSHVALIIAGFIITCFILVKLHVKKYLDRLINYLYLVFVTRKHNKLDIIDYYHKNVVATIHLHDLPLQFKDMMFKESVLMNYPNIKVLAVTRNKLDIGQTDGNTILCDDDIILVYGPEEELNEIFC